MAPRKKKPATSTNGALKPAKKPVTPKAIDGGDGPIQYLSINAAGTAFGALIDRADAWHEQDGRMIYGDPDGTYLTVAPQTDSDSAQIAISKILAQGPEAAQSLLFLMSRDLARGPDPTGKMFIHVNEILTFKDIKKHPSGDYRASQKLEEAERLRGLNRLIIFVDETITIKRGRGAQLKRVKVESRLIELEIEREIGDVKNVTALPARAKPARKGAQPQISLFTEGNNDKKSTAIAARASEPPPYRFRVSLGGWANQFRQQPNLIGSVLRRVGQYRVTQIEQRIAVQIALAIMFQPKLEWTVGDLLESAKVALPDDHPDRFQKSFDEALDLLKKDKLIADWTYADDCPDLPKYKWFPVWLGYKIHFKPRPRALA